MKYALLVVILAGVGLASPLMSSPDNKLYLERRGNETSPEPMPEPARQQGNMDSIKKDEPCEKYGKEGITVDRECVSEPSTRQMYSTRKKLHNGLSSEPVPADAIDQLKKLDGVTVSDRPN
ncbi:hypothetical protein HRG_014878 [Hirsutella rhossiliensis]